VEQAERDVDEQRRRWLAELADEREDFLAELRRRTAGRLGELSRKVLADLADADLQQKVADVFVQRIEALDKEARAPIREALGGGDEPVRVSAAFELSDKQAKQVRKAVETLVGDDADVRFTRDEGLLCGVQLQAAGRAVGWNIAGYVGELIDAIDEEIERRIRELREPAEQSGDERQPGAPPDEKAPDDEQEESDGE
jgi:F-type H+-transporting ATPase subunit b